MQIGQTLRALLEPRRLVPLVLVTGSMLAAEWLATESAAALLVDLMLIVAFALISPVISRSVSRRDASWVWQLGGWLLHVNAALVVVAGVTLLLPPVLGIRWTYLSDPNSFGVLVVLFVVGGWGLGRDIELSLGVERERARAERLAIEAEHAQLLALRAQLDPHFLFNTLNAIAEWCREDPVVAEAATLKLASILRTIFEALQHPEWSLDREVSLVEQLAQLYAVRDASRYVFRIEADESTKSLTVPALVLLPLFENAIKHGPAAGHAGSVSLAARREGASTLVEIRNPGTFGGKREGGQGVTMVERRLALAYGGRASLSLVGDGGETVATVKLPSNAAERPS